MIKCERRGVNGSFEAKNAIDAEIINLVNNNANKYSAYWPMYFK